MIVKVIITLKKGVLDPQGKAIQQTLIGMNFSSVNEVRQGKFFEINVNENIYIININDKYIAESMNLADNIRKDLGVSVYTDSLRRSIKSQMRHANKMHAKFCIIFDSKELKNEKIIIDMIDFL